MANRLGLALALAAGLAPGPLGAQSDDFDDGNDDGWIRYDPHNAAVISFPNGAYRLQGSTVNPAPDTARVFVYRDVDYTDFYCAVDIVAWDNSLNQAFGVFFRAQNIGPGTTTGYAAYWTPAISGGGNRLFSIIPLINDVPGQNISAVTLMLDTNKSYRLVVKGVGDRLTAEIYDLEDLTAPIATQSVVNNLFPSGKCGLFVYSRNRTTADATFDNYYAAATAPTAVPPPATPHPVPGTPQVVDRTPVSNKNLHPPQDGIAFTATTLGGADIPTANIRLELNGQDVSAGLSFSGPANARRVTYAGLQANQLYHARITLTDTTGKSSVNQWWFDTFSEAFLYSESVKIIEAEDYNYGQGQFQDPVEPSGFNSQGQQVNGNGIGYLGLLGILSVDYFDSSPDAGGTPPVPHVYRPDSVETDFGAQLYLYLDPVMGIAVAKTNDTPLQRFVAYDLPDYHVLNTEGGEWLNYTRSFPSGRYQAYLRASCQTPQDVFLDGVTSDRTQFGQTTVRLARFACQPTGHLSIFRYFPAVDENGNPAILEFTEGERTLRLTIGGEPEARTRYNLQLNYLMLVRVGDLPFRLYKPVRSGDTFSVSFLSTPGLIYTLQYKDSLSDPDWVDGEWVIGTGWEQTLSDISTGPTRFYRVKAD